MRHGFVKVATATPRIRVADPGYNSKQIIRLYEKASAQGAQVIVFPELCLTGYTCGDLFLQDTMLDEAEQMLKVIAAATDGLDGLAFIGMPLRKDGRLYNVAAVLSQGKILGFIPKINIPAYSEYYETRHFTKGPKEVSEVMFDGRLIPFGARQLFECRGVSGCVVACEICEDLWVPASPSIEHCMAGATVIVNLSASDEIVGKAEYRRSLVESVSGRLLCGYVYANAGIGESSQDVVFSGHSLIAENGMILEESQLFDDGLLMTELDMGKLSMERRRMTTFGDESSEEYRVSFFDTAETLHELTRRFPRFPFIPSNEADRNKRCEVILNIQVDGLCKRFAHTKAQSAVIGISGGLDSTLALLVTARCFDNLGLERKDIIAVTMPCFGTTDRTYENACQLARSMGATLREIDIKDSVISHFKDIEHDLETYDATYENGQARERTQVLMDLANANAGLVIGTGDMSELALGWATYNGDHMSMYGVNCSVPKTLVRYLVDYEAARTKDENLRKVLLDVLDTPVSPELIPPANGEISQKTEDLVGPYELHDYFLYYMLRCGYSPEKIFRIAKQTFEGVYDPSTILKWEKIFYKRFFAQQFKRSCIPDGPKVGSVALSPRGDLRMPSDASAAAWLRQLEHIEI